MRSRNKRGLEKRENGASVEPNKEKKKRLSNKSKKRKRSACRTKVKRENTSKEKRIAAKSDRNQSKVLRVEASALATGHWTRWSSEITQGNPTYKWQVAIFSCCSVVALGFIQQGGRELNPGVRTTKRKDLNKSVPIIRASSALRGQDDYLKVTSFDISIRPLWMRRYHRWGFRNFGLTTQGASFDIGLRQIFSKNLAFFFPAPPLSGGAI
jgi:hypothetical protein